MGCGYASGLWATQTLEGSIGQKKQAEMACFHYMASPAWGLDACELLKHQLGLERGGHGGVVACDPYDVHLGACLCV